MQPPPPPPSTTPPPLPLSDDSALPPRVPEGLKTHISASAISDPSTNAKFQSWRNHVKLIGTAVLTYEMLQSTEVEYVKAIQTTKTQFFDSLPDQEKNRLNAEVKKLYSQREETRQQLKKVMHDSRKVSAWPIAPFQLSAAEWDRYKVLIKDVLRLRDRAQDLKSSLDTIPDKPAVPEWKPLFLVGTESDEEDENLFLRGMSRMDIDHLRVSAGTLKRRRGTNDWGADSDSFEDAPPTLEEMQTLHLELDLYQDKLADIKHSVELDAEQRKQKIRLEVDNRMEKIQDERASEQHALGEQANAHDANQQATIQELETQAFAQSESLSAVKARMAAIQDTVNDLREDFRKETLGLEQSQQRMSQLMKRLEFYTSADLADAMEIQKLKSILDKLSHPEPEPEPEPEPQSPESEPLPPKDALYASPSYLLEILENSLLEPLQQTIRPLIEDLRKAVQDIVEKHNAHLFTTVWTRIIDTLMILDMIQKHLEAGNNASGPGVLV